MFPSFCRHRSAVRSVFFECRFITRLGFPPISLHVLRVGAAGDGGTCFPCDLLRVGIAWDGEMRFSRGLLPGGAESASATILPGVAEGISATVSLRVAESTTLRSPPGGVQRAPPLDGGVRRPQPTNQQTNKPTSIRELPCFDFSHISVFKTLKRRPH